MTTRHELPLVAVEFARVRSGRQSFVVIPVLPIAEGHVLYLQECELRVGAGGTPRMFMTGRVTSCRAASVWPLGLRVIVGIERVWSHADGGDLLEGRLARIEEFVAEIRELSHPPGNDQKMAELVKLLAMFLPGDTSRVSGIEIVDD